MANYNQSHPTVTACVFSHNSVHDIGALGGGIFNSASSPEVTNSLFFANWVGYGGCIRNESSSPTLTNCTVTGSTGVATYGGGVSNKSSSPTVANCIIWGNAGAEFYNDNSTPSVTYSDVEGGYSGAGNIDLDPLFRSGDDLHLSTGSPCIEAGDNDAVPAGITTDLDGVDRFLDADDDGLFIVDMGAYEYFLDTDGDGEGDAWDDDDDND